MQHVRSKETKCDRRRLRSSPERLGCLAGLNDGLLRVCSSVLSHSNDAGIGVVPVLSCGNDVGGIQPDELDVEEVVDKPGTTIGT